MGLGPHFPESVRRDHAVRNLTPGRVLYLASDFTKPPKEKLVVLVSLDDSPLVFVINSRIAQFIQATPCLLACQVTPVPADHDFLDHDSFLNCAEVREMTRQEIVDQLVADPTRNKGEVSAHVRVEVVRVVRQAKSVSSIHKQRIMAALS